MNLPEQYTYISVKNEANNRIYRVKELTSGCAAEVWVHKFSKLSYETWRVSKTYPKAGRKNIFRKDYRCQHLTDKRAIGAGPSKNTDCPAKLEVFVRRYVKHTKSKNVDSLTKEYPGVIVLKYEHNHPIYKSDTWHHIDMSPETKDELDVSLETTEELDMSPGTTVELDMSPETTEELDMSPETTEELDISPETTEELDVSPGTTEELDMSPETTEELDMSPETTEELDISPETTEELDVSPGTTEELDMSPETTEELDMSPETTEELDVSPETKEKLSALFRQGLSPSSARNLLNIDLMMNSAENYHKFASDGRYLPTLSTVRKLFEEDFVSAENALISALDTYGKYSGVNAAAVRAAKQLLQLSHKTVIGVKPTAPAHRKLLLSGRKKLNVRQPDKLRGPLKKLSCHNYTSFGVLPKRQ